MEDSFGGTWKVGREMLVILVWDIECVKCEVGFCHLCFKKLLNGSNVYHSLRKFDVIS